MSKQNMSLRQISEATELQLSDLLGQVSGALRELSDTCTDLQELQSASSMKLDADEVVRAQALDRVTQSLECLSRLNEALSITPSIQGVSVSEDVVHAIKLPSVRKILESSMNETSEEFVDVELF